MKRIRRAALASAFGSMAFLAFAPDARALTLVVSSTSAIAYDSLGPSSQGPTSASVSHASGTMTAAAVANLTTGHLGASATNSATGSVSADADTRISFDVSDVDPTDYLLIQTILNGSITSQMGVAGTVYFRVYFDNDPIQTSGIQCSYFHQVYDGTTCMSQVYGQAVASGNQVMVLIDATSLANASTLTLEWELQVGAGSNGPGSADFLNSADFVVTVPQGTTVTGNPGGTLISFATVPEPTTLCLLGAGAAGLGWTRRHRERRRSHAA
jgi:hypothetical protein